MNCECKALSTEAATPPDDEVALARRAMDAWARRDLEATLACMSEDIQHILNIDGSAVPVGASVTGKAELRAKLLMFLDTFDFDAFVIDGVQACEGGARASVLIYYRHKSSGHRLNVRFRFVFRVRDGLICVLEEYHDAAYIEAFMRLAEGASPT